jgi:carboxyl-terminal processing protease
MDDYTEFFTIEEARQFMETVGGTYSGVGVVLSQTESYVVVTRVFSLSPAEKSGIMIGDKIATIDGKDVLGSSVDEVSSLIRGEEDTQVYVGILRDKSLHNYTLTRKSIKINPINYEIRDGIAYISIDTFNSNTYDYWAEAQNAADEAGLTGSFLI